VDGVSKLIFALAVRSRLEGPHVTSVWVRGAGYDTGEAVSSLRLR
jgi:hypothetical protein